MFRKEKSIDFARLGRKMKTCFCVDAAISLDAGWNALETRTLFSLSLSHSAAPDFVISDAAVAAQNKLNLLHSLCDAGTKEVKHIFSYRASISISRSLALHRAQITSSKDNTESAS